MEGILASDDVSDVEVNRGCSAVLFWPPPHTSHGRFVADSLSTSTTFIASNFSTNKLTGKSPQPSSGITNSRRHTGHDNLQQCCNNNMTLLRTLHWLPVEQRINYKLAVLTFKTQQTSYPQYLSQHISLRTSARNTRSSSVPLLCVPFRRTSFSRRSYSTAAPLTWKLELTATCRIKLRLSLYFQIQA